MKYIFKAIKEFMEPDEELSFYDQMEFVKNFLLFKAVFFFVPRPTSKSHKSLQPTLKDYNVIFKNVAKLSLRCTQSTTYRSDID